MMTAEQQDMMNDAFAALVSEGVSIEQMEELLSQDMPPEVKKGMMEQCVSLAVLITLMAAAAKVDYNQAVYEMADFIFLAGWNARANMVNMVAEDLVH